MQKRGQLTIFLMFGIIIVIAAIFVSYIQSETPKTKIGAETERINSLSVSSLASVKDSIDYCVSDTSSYVVYYTSLQGGYYNVPEPKTQYFGDMPYYEYKGQNKMPSIKTIESEISNFIFDILPTCVEQIETQGFELNGKINSVETSVLNDKILVKVNYPISIKRGDQETVIPRFNAEVPIRLSTMYEIASNITQGKVRSNSVCLDCLVILGNKNNVFIDVLSSNNSLIFSLYDNTTSNENTTQNEEPYIFSFALQK